MLKRLLWTAVAGAAFLGLSAAANAASNGYYMGIDMGWAAQENTKGHVWSEFDISSNQGFGGRYSFGYQMNPYLALDSGLYYFTDDFFHGDFQRGLDLGAKAILPIDDFKLFGKLGGTYVYQSGEDDIRPMYSVGAGLDLTDNWVLETSWMRIIGGGSANDSNFISTGLSYHFG